MRDDKVWSRFPLTRQVCEPADDTEPDERAHRLLAALAEDSGGAMRQVEPGVWVVDKLRRTPPAG